MTRLHRITAGRNAAVARRVSALVSQPPEVSPRYGPNILLDAGSQHRGIVDCNLAPHVAEQDQIPASPAKNQSGSLQQTNPEAPRSWGTRMYLPRDAKGLPQLLQDGGLARSTLYQLASCAALCCLSTSFYSSPGLLLHTSWILRTSRGTPSFSRQYCSVASA